MINRFLCLLVLSISSYGAVGQKFKAVKSTIHFFSDAPVEDIEAINKKASSVMDLSTNSIVFSVPINQFVFAKSLMQEHFNENYLESHKYPKAIFMGTMYPTPDKEGESVVVVKGEMNLHGVKKYMEVEGVLNKSGGTLNAHAEFNLLLKDFAIKIPTAVFYNIAEEISITVDFTYEPF